MKTTTKIASTAMSIAAALLGWTSSATAGKLDAVSGSSIKMTGGTTTATTASLACTFTETGGTWRLYYDIADHTATSAFPKSVATTNKTFNLTGLTASTKYYYWVIISDGRHKDGSLHSDGAKIVTAFTTDAAAGIRDIDRATFDNSANPAVDPMGRRGQNRGPIRINELGTQIDLNQGHR